MPKRSWSNAVRKIVRQELPRPEWKCYQAAESAAATVLGSAWTISDLTANITQGVTASDRLGRSIRVHRIDLWAEFRAPDEPQTGEVQVTAGFLRNERAPGSSTDPTTLTFDTCYDAYARNSSTWGDGLDPRLGKAPPRIDLASTLGWHLFDIRRLQLRAAPRSYDVSIASSGDPLYGATTTTTEQFTGTQTQQNAGNVSAITLIKDTHAMGGTVTRIRKRVVFHKRYPNKGLYVDYSDSTDADVVQNLKSNHIYWFAVSNVANGASALAKPSVYYAYRIWFTDE